MVRRFLALLPVAFVLAITGIVVTSNQAEAKGVEFNAKLRDPTGRVVGSATFRVTHHAMQVEATLRPNANVAANAFHGFHIHTNSDPTNGEGCQADPTQPSTTWFVSADGHLSTSGQVHGQHNGDLPSPLVLADGTAKIAFTTDRIDPAVLRGKALILHTKPDNFGNIPTGDASTAYTPNSPAATDLTARTGNASDRVACGIIHRSRTWR
jgi:Cu-Zn family superoxide dismutase